MVKGGGNDSGLASSTPTPEDRRGFSGVFRPLRILRFPVVGGSFGGADPLGLAEEDAIGWRNLLCLAQLGGALK